MECKQWKKVLYEDQGFPTNYTDDTFLESMKKNVNTRMHDLRTVIFESGIVSQQLASICILVCVFINLENSRLDPETLILLVSCLLLVGFLVHHLLYQLHPDISSFLVVSILIFGFSPILKTLMKTISTDTIYAMTVFMFMCNMLFHDYGVDVAIVSKAISLNAGVFGAVCLSSRLQTTIHVYACVYFAVMLFAILPEVRKAVKKFHRKAYILQTEGMVLLAISMLNSINQAGALALFISHVAITFLFPLWMIRLQALKNNIYGPWDEAMIE
eukprot:TCONS_00020420-protein